jgi:hypothetical protein
VNRPLIGAVVAALAVTAIFVALRTAPPTPPRDGLAARGALREYDRGHAQGVRRRDAPAAARASRRRLERPRAPTTAIAPASTTTTTTPAAALLAADVLERCRALERTTRFWATRVMHLRVRSTGLPATADRDLALGVAARRTAAGGGDALVYAEGGPDSEGVSALLSIAPGGERRYHIWMPGFSRLERVSPETAFHAITYDDLARIAGVASWCDLGGEATLNARMGAADQRSYALLLQRPALQGVERAWLELGHGDLAPTRIEYDRGTDEAAQRIWIRELEWAGARPVARWAEAEWGNVLTVIETVGVEWDEDIPECLFDVWCTMERPRRGGCCRG